MCGAIGNDDEMGTAIIVLARFIGHKSSATLFQCLTTAYVEMQMFGILIVP